MLKLAFSAAAATASAVLFAVTVAPANASTFTVDFRSAGETGRFPSVGPFTGPSAGPFQLTAIATPDSPQGYVTANAVNGLCIFANGNDGINRCGVLSNEERVNNNYNRMAVYSNIPVTYTGFNISQVLNNGFIDPNPPGTGIVSLRRGTFSGEEVATIDLSKFIPGSNQLFSSPITFNAGEYLVFRTSGLNSSIRLGSLTMDEVASNVPGPLPLLGASAAFGWTRRMRRRLVLVQRKFSV